MAGDHPDVPFIQALKYGTGRPDGPPLWVVWHTTEEEELADTAERVARYFATLPDGRSVSSHYVVDVDSIVQCVLLKDRAWTVGNTPGNNRGINVELAGHAAQTAAQWADQFSRAMLGIACRIVARDMTEYAIPNRWCTVADLVARRPGHTTHNDLRIAFGGTTHTDPGPNFPRDLVLALVAGGGEDDMDAYESAALRYVDNRLAALTAGLDKVVGTESAPQARGQEVWPVQVLKAVAADVAELKARPPAEFTPEDAAKLAALLVPLIKGEMQAANEEAIRNVLGGLDGATPA